jgi:acyl-CoA reductase-like NAD-dependent aldehyde dehydrogenase
MGRKTQSQEITNTGIMVKGIRAHQETLVRRKINNTFADELQSNVDACITLNVEQETLKAKLKAKTEEFDKAFATMQKKAAEARKIIKLDIPQSSWREFGIDDKK